MGAQQFKMTVSALLHPDAEAAEARAWEQAGGFDVPYTGTMASKDGVTRWPAAPFDFAGTGLSVETITRALHREPASVAAFEAATLALPVRLDLEEMQDTYNAKYSPAVMFRHRHVWVLCGFASC